jgi:transcriptional regulator with XRE-family HTH domain
VVRTLEETPEGATHWSKRELAKRVGISPASVHQIWRAFGLQPWRTEDFKISPARGHPAAGSFDRSLGEPSGARSWRRHGLLAHAAQGPSTSIGHGPEGAGAASAIQRANRRQLAPRGCVMPLYHHGPWSSGQSQEGHRRTTGNPPSSGRCFEGFDSGMTPAFAARRVHERPIRSPADPSTSAGMGRSRWPGSGGSGLLPCWIPNRWTHADQAQFRQWSAIAA